MKLYLISQNVNTGYDTYSDAVVCANSEQEARLIHPDGYSKVKADSYDPWCDASDVKVEYIGEADKSIKEGVICASFHAG